VIKDVTVLKHGKINLFSIPKMLTQGWKLGGDGEQIWIFKENARIDFDIKFPTPKGALYAMYFKCNMETGLAATSTGAKMPIMKAHSLLGHCNEDTTHKAAGEYGWLLTGSWKPCEACAAGKARQKNVPKESEHKPADKDANQIFLDIETVKKLKNGPNVTKPNWQIMVDERTGINFLTSMRQKMG
jgi:hypothetical protein